MEFLFLGTAASEGWPALFCNCPQCKAAAELGGRNIRTRSQALLDGHILFDFPPDTYKHKLDGALDLSRVDLLLVTHSHSDHLYPNDLATRGAPYGHNFTAPTLHIASGHDALARIERVNGYENNKLSNIVTHELRAYEPFECCGARVIPLPADHLKSEDAFCYAIETNGKHILYLHDTGEVIPDVLDYLAHAGICYDLISFDCCYCVKDNTHLHGHMGLPNVVRLRNKLLASGVCDRHTFCMVNHFSHNIAVTHESMTAAAAREGMLCSYDGMRLEI